MSQDRRKKFYRIWNAQWHLMCEGSSTECAEALGVDEDAIHRIAHRCKAGKLKKYHVEVTEYTGGTKRLLEEFNEKLMEPPKYPCDSCTGFQPCRRRDTWCRLWAEWYKKSHDKACRGIRKALKGESQ